MSAVLDVSEYELPEDLGMLKGASPDEEDLDPEDAFWEFMAETLEHEEDV